jgi:hypothetical protein
MVKAAGVRGVDTREPLVFARLIKLYRQLIASGPILMYIFSL